MLQIDIQGMSVFLSNKWITWFPREYFWLWLTGFILLMPFVTKGICELLKFGLSEPVMKGTIPEIVFFSACFTGMALIWHYLIPLLVFCGICVVIFGTIPFLLGYLCYLRSRKVNDS